MLLVEHLEAVERRLLEFGESDGAIEVRIGSRDRFGHVEQGVTSGTLRTLVQAVACGI